jgi:hypothetical protein
VRVELLTPIGKEIVVDPTDTDEGLTAETLGATETLEYHNPAEELEALRARITEASESLRAIAREARIDRRTIQRFVYQGWHFAGQRMRSALKRR